ncbi:MAG TPA: acylphosphatase [Candidatus Diapherotrites archaeon]|uniref:acylphosphatase n=1 Tax=Candidatus Iainarchaeum sp. TaxID=3101447 RepID=A0A7J4JJ38_9ARCH|nr:acylphosphatase [Candidatus Diapherotrites archaeon]HIH15947.1 acylphosphatase [Candidatus Diapherotrites archaeon]
MPALKRLHALVLGSVQGVNYRLFVRHVAGVHRLVGWVKNLDDGRVEVLAEGEEHALKEFVRALEEGPPGAEVKEVECTWHEASGEFKGFEKIY